MLRVEPDLSVRTCPRSSSENELAKLIINISSNNGVKPVYKDPRPGDIVHSLADTSKAGAFGYNPRYSLEQGLKETIESLEKAKAD